MGYKTISMKLGEKMIAVCVIIQKWKTYKMTMNHLCFGAPCKILLHGVKIIMGKVGDQPKITREEFVNDLNPAGTTIIENTIGNSVRTEWM